MDGMRLSLYVRFLIILFFTVMILKKLQKLCLCWAIRPRFTITYNSHFSFFLNKNSSPNLFVLRRSTSPPPISRTSPSMSDS